MWVIIDEETGSLMFKPRAGSCLTPVQYGGGTDEYCAFRKDVIIILSDC